MPLVASLASLGLFACFLEQTRTAPHAVHGLDVVREVTRRFPGTRVVVLSAHSDEAYVAEALRNGASAFVLKDAAPDELACAIRETAAGRRYLGPPLSERAIEAYLRRAEGAALDPYATLTAREREVLPLAAEGLTNADIARRLVVSPRTVEVHRGRLMKKLELKNQTELVLFAVRRGIIRPGG